MSKYTDGNWLPIRIGIDVCLISQFLFMLGYANWETHKYLERHSTSGFRGWLFGFPIGALAGVVAAKLTTRSLAARH